jgi:hypothetical protein
VAGSQAVIDWTSNDAAVLRSFQKVERGFDDIARRMQRVEQQGQRTTASMSGGFDRLASSIGKTAMALIGGGSLLTAVDMVRDANRKMLEEAQNAGKEFDRIFRDFRVQAGLNAVESDQAQARILAVGQKYAVGADVAGAAAKGLIGAGFPVQAATGDALGVLLETQKAMVASNKAPADAERLAKDAAAYLGSQGLPSNAANLRQAMHDAFALRAGAFELGDFAELGKHGAAFTGRLSQQEQIAAFGTLVDVMPAAEAGTALRNMVTRMSSARVGRTSEKALKEMGLKPEDIDLVGENFGTALERIQGGLAGMPEEQRAGALKQLFEEAGVAPANVLLGELGGKYAKYQAGMATSPAEFGAAAAVAVAGRGAGEARLAGQNKAAQAAEDAGDDLVAQAIEAEHRARGIGTFGRWLGQGQLSPISYQNLRSYGVSQETAIGMLSMSPDFPKAVLGRVEAATGGEMPPRFTTVESINERERREAAAQAEEDRRRARAGSSGVGVRRSTQGWTFGRKGGKFGGIPAEPAQPRVQKVEVVNQPSDPPRVRELPPQGSIGR